MEAISLVAAVAQLLQMGAGGIVALRKTVPEYGRFWDAFERQLKPERDVPWETIASNCHLQPDFIASAISYIAGDDDGRKTMEAYFECFLEPPDGAEIDRAALLARVSSAARQAANAAASSDRRASLADRRLVIGAILDASNAVTDEIHKVRADLAVMGQRLEDGLTELREQLPEQNGEAIEREERDASPRVALDAKEIDALLERAGEVFLEKQRQAQAEAAAAHTSPSPTAPPPAPVLPTTRGVESMSPQDHLERLRQSAPNAASDIEQLIRDRGVSGLVTALRGDAVAHDLDTLVAVGRILSSSGVYAEAELAYLRAADLDLDASTKARQLVRAARIADLQGSEERRLRHLERARRVDPSNSSLAIAEARHSNDSAWALERLDGVDAIDDAERALLHQSRAQAHLALGDEEAARRELELAAQADATNVVVREFRGLLVLHEAQQRAAARQEQNIETLRRTGELFESLADGLLHEKRLVEASLEISRAAQAFMLGRQFDRASALLDKVPPPGSLPAEVGLVVAQTAAICQRPDLVLRYTSSDSTEPSAQLLRSVAYADLPDTDERDLQHAVAVLKSYLESDDETVSERAAFGLLDIAITHKEVDWDIDAAKIVAADRPEIVAAMRAERHMLLGEYDDAEAALLPFAEHSTYQRRLRDYAAAAGNWPKVVDRSRQLIKDHNDANDRLALAQALRHTEGPAASRDELLRVARDTSVEDRLRDAAFGAAIEIVGAGRDYGAILELAQEWQAAVPTSGNANWNVLFGLARLSRHEEAYTLAERLQPDASTPERATLLAEIYFRAAPRREAVAMIVGLSDRFDRKLEALEALIIGSSLATEPNEIGESLGRRIQDTFRTFEERFPRSQAIRSFPAPETAEEFGELLKQMAGSRPARQAQLLNAIRDGGAPVNAFAALSPDPVGGTWRSLLVWPLGFATDHQDDADRAAARDAIGGATVLDSSSIVVLSELHAIKQKLLAALPGSAISNETLADLDEDMQPSGSIVGRTEHLPDGSVVVHEIDPEHRAAAAQSAANGLSTARALAILPPLGDGVSNEILRLYDDAASNPEVRALFATVALAQRINRPVFSDDRWIREFARAMGVGAFGTLALLDALHERNVITSDEHLGARVALAKRGAWGLSLTGPELIAAGRTASFEVDETVFGILYDRAAWRARPAERFRASGALLSAVFDERPEHFKLWLHQILEAAYVSIPHMDRSWFVEALLVLCWFGSDDFDMPDACFHALIDETKRLPVRLTTLGRDAIIGSIDRMLATASDQTERFRFLFFCLIIRRLRVFDAARAMLTFLESPGPR